MNELRWNPLLGTYTLVAANRQQRPNLPTHYNPFGKQNPKLPAHFRVLSYPNDYPALNTQPITPTERGNSLFRAAPAYGVCEVILYAQDEHTTLTELSPSHLQELVDLWCERCQALEEDPKIRLVMPFENRGEAVGVTIHHPHGQIYAYSWVPQKLLQEHEMARKHFETHKTDLIGDLLAAEKADGARLIFETEHWVCWLPYFTDYPYGIFLAPKRFCAGLKYLTAEERQDFGAVFQKAVQLLDAVLNCPMPYMMCIHQAAVHSPELGCPENYFRLHVEFYPVLRAVGTVKFYASSEMGAWAATNTRCVEDTAQELRDALHKLMNPPH